MKYILILAFMFLSLEAQIENKQMYAKVISNMADLYHIPSEYGEKKVNYFKKGDMLPIEYCDKSSWCKISNGYVQKQLLRIPEPILKNVVKMPKYKREIIKEVQSEPVVVLTKKTTQAPMPKPIENTLPKAEMYAKVTSHYADLYKIPNKDAARKENYFKEGDMVGVIYCDKSSWCKTSNGYIQKELLTISKPIVADVPVVPSVTKSAPAVPNKVGLVMTPHGVELASTPSTTRTRYTVPPITQPAIQQKVIIPNVEVIPVRREQNIIHDNSTIYARLLPNKANLYTQPSVNARQSVDYFQKGDRIKIEYCEGYEWCKTVNGYIKQDDIILSNALMQEARAKYHVVSPKQAQKRNVIIKREVLPTQKVSHIEKKTIITKTKYVKIVEDIGEYENYFKDDSAKVVFTKGE